MTAKITGIDEAVKNFTACRDNGLSPRIMFDRSTGEVWTSELVNEDDWIEYLDASVMDITAEALEEHRQRILVAFSNNVAGDYSVPSLADAVLPVALRALAA